MSFTYAELKKQGSKKNGAEPFVSSGKESSLPNSAQSAELGHQVDMPVVMREKMEGAFGMDLSSVKLYENRAVSDAGAEAVTQGSRIAFAPGKLDFSSTRGQALLGHEISHVASQAKGEVKGSGLVNDSALEARADREGMMAAHGESVSAGYGGASAPLSAVSAASAAGPMQAKSGKKKQEKAKIHNKGRAEMESANSYYSTSQADEDEELDRLERERTEADIDRMFAIKSGGAGDPDIVSKEDQDWLQDMTSASDPKRQERLLRGIMDRMYGLRANIGKNWEKAGGKQMDYKTSKSVINKDNGLYELGIYQDLFSDIGVEFPGTFSQGLSKFTDNYQKQQSPEHLAAVMKGVEAVEDYRDSEQTIAHMNDDGLEQYVDPDYIPWAISNYENYKAKDTELLNQAFIMKKKKKKKKH